MALLEQMNNWMSYDPGTRAKACATFCVIVETARAMTGMPVFVDWLLNKFVGEHNPKEINYSRYIP